jgi:uncharacterized membrane protein
MITLISVSISSIGVVLAILLGNYIAKLLDKRYSK